MVSCVCVRAMHTLAHIKSMRDGSAPKTLMNAIVPHISLAQHNTWALLPARWHRMRSGPASPRLRWIPADNSSELEAAIASSCGVCSPRNCALVSPTPPPPLGDLACVNFTTCCLGSNTLHFSHILASGTRPCLAYYISEHVMHPIQASTSVAGG